MHRELLGLICWKILNLLKFEGFVLRLCELIFAVLFVRNSVGQTGLQGH
jgi:hypothetical protein